MAYVKNTWVNGDVITAEKMNHIEDGIESDGSGGSNLFAIAMTYDSDSNTYNLDKTWNEINEAFIAGKNCVITCTEGGNDEYLLVLRMKIYEYSYALNTYSASYGGDMEFIADTVNDYPICSSFQ